MIQDYQTLIALTQRYLLEEYKAQDWIWATVENTQFFRKTSVPPAKKAPPPILKPVPIVKRQAPLPPPPPVKIEEQPKKEPPKRETMIKPQNSKVDFSELRAILREKAASLQVMEEIPSDDKAHLIANAWKNDIPEVVLVVSMPTNEQGELVQKIAEAIKTLGYTARVFEFLDWKKFLTVPHLKLILAPQDLLQSESNFRFDQSRNRYFLDGVMVCPMLPLETYIKEPKEKGNLWQNIKELLKTN